MTVEIIHPKDEAAWHRARGQDVTASTVGALFGEHDFMTEYKLWALKTGRLKQDLGENEAIRRGRLLEPVAVQILREDYPTWTFEHNASENIYFRDPDKRIGATPDVIAWHPERGKGVIQIKSVEASTFRRKWHPDGDMSAEPEPPFWIALQTMQEAHLTGARWGAVLPLVISYGIEAPLIDVPLDHMAGVMRNVENRVAEFWQMIAEGREPEIDYDRDGPVIDAMNAVGDPAHEVDLTGDKEVLSLIEIRNDQRERLAMAEAEIARMDTRIKAKMGAAEVAHIAGGQTIRWKTHKRTNPDGSRSVYRVLRYPKL